MNEPFALRYAEQPAPDPATPYTYDHNLQLNVLSDGTPAAERHDILRQVGTTTSTAGSKTHFDD